MGRLVDTIDVQRNTIEAFEEALRSSRVPLADRVEQEMAEEMAASPGGSSSKHRNTVMEKYK